MRAHFFETLTDIARIRRDIFVLTADLGYKLFDRFRSSFAERFINAGVAESNMVGIASGLSLCGKNVYCYSIIPFLVMRAYEQIRIDIAYSNLNVKLVGVGGGFTYGMEGITHFGFEDFSLMRSLPNMRIVCPADPLEAHTLAKISAEEKGPLYIRLGQNGDSAIHEKTPALEIGKAMILQEGRDVAIFAIGNMVSMAKKASELLQRKGIASTVINMHTLSPLDAESISQIASAHDALFSLEEHNFDGGLGTAIGEVLLKSGYRGIFRKFGIPCNVTKIIGKADFLRYKCGLTPESVSQSILNEINV
jgi:transketolase